ncbi:RimK/LysX family protein [Salinibacterium sp. SYSU T00001]|uniref:ATP-dependent zinc protease family protein n=1 Tax=Homoserinimonas sedimenticola TaxID=2986805 RepID=UPI002235B64F|nr:RimK/LysX family protein [Salinibacterium sedimenticola]MCW4386646.1 RimK/LysX family protein [Salinibacterium sedimenticola]
MRQDPHSSTTVGWREWVSLPDHGVPWIKAKLDTGARTSSIHAFDIEVVEAEQGERVRFWVHPWQESARDAVQIECPVHDRRSVRSSSGHAATRIVVHLDVSIHGRVVTAEFTLANRDSMGFRMLIGREALRKGFVVDSARSFVGGRAPREVRRINRGRHGH